MQFYPSCDGIEIERKGGLKKVNSLNPNIRLILMCLFLIYSSNGYAIFVQGLHYKGVLIGDRSVGMGGAFTAIADDPSGSYYNPAGLAFSQSSDIQASVTAYKRSVITYKDILKGFPQSDLGKDYRENPADFTEYTTLHAPPYVGGIQTLGNLKIGFSIINDINSSIDQNDVFKEVQISPGTVHTLYRTYQLKETRTLIGPSFAYRIRDAFSIGLTLYYYNYSLIFSGFDFAIRNYDATYNQSGMISKNIYLNMNNQGLIPVLGFQAMLGKLSLGLSIRKGINYKDQNDYVGSMHRTYDGKDYKDKQDEVDEANAKIEDESKKITAQLGEGSNSEVEDLDGWEEDNPLQINAGAALYATSSILVSAEYNYHAAVKPGSDFDNDRKAVHNWAVGMEYYISPHWPLRFGVFSDYSFAPPIDHDQFNQLEHIDYYGGSLSISWAQKNSSITVGSVYQLGTGEAQKISPRTENGKTIQDVQDVEARGWTIFYAGTYSF